MRAFSQQVLQQDLLASLQSEASSEPRQIASVHRSGFSQQLNAARGAPMEFAVPTMLKANVRCGFRALDVRH